MSLCVDKTTFIDIYNVLVGQLLKMREDDIRMFLQELSKNQFDEDSIISELESVNSELRKTRLAIPPPVVEPQDLKLLNAQAHERGLSNGSSPNHSFAVVSNGHPHSSGHAPMVLQSANGRPR